MTRTKLLKIIENDTNAEQNEMKFSLENSPNNLIVIWNGESQFGFHFSIFLSLFGNRKHLHFLGKPFFSDKRRDNRQILPSKIFVDRWRCALHSTNATHWTREKRNGQNNDVVNFAQVIFVRSSWNSIAKVMTTTNTITQRQSPIELHFAWTMIAFDMHAHRH